MTIGASTTSATTEERTINAITQNAITLNANLSVNHSAGAEIVNITRNCVITSTGTGAGFIGKAYIRNLSTTEANFNMYYTEASYLGSNNSGKYGITFDGSGTRGKINYCSIDNGFRGIHLNNSDNNILTNNNCYLNSQFGIYLIPNCTNNKLSNNNCYLNSIGIFLESGSTNNTIHDNICYSNTRGIELTGSSDMNNVINNNNCYSNSLHGIFLSNNATNNILSNNSCYSNSYGICAENSGNNSVLNCSL